MATVEKTAIFTQVDGGGNMTLLYPVTTMDAVDGLNETVNALQPRAQARQIALTVSGWSQVSGGYAQTAPVSGMTANASVLVTPAPDSLESYGECGVCCTAQAQDSVTFSAGSVPESALNVNILILM